VVKKPSYGPEGGPHLLVNSQIVMYYIYYQAQKLEIFHPKLNNIFFLSLIFTITHYLYMLINKSYTDDVIKLNKYLAKTYWIEKRHALFLEVYKKYI